MFDKFTLQNLANKSEGVQTKILYFLYIIIGRCFFIIQTSNRMQFFTVLQDKLHSFNIQGDRSTGFLCTANCRIDHITKRFHEENSIMLGLFGQINLLLCGMQLRVIMGFNENVQKISKIIYTTSRFPLLTSAKLAVRAVFSIFQDELGQENRSKLHILRNIFFLFEVRKCLNAKVL